MLGRGGVGWMGDEEREKEARGEGGGREEQGDTLREGG